MKKISIVLALSAFLACSTVVSASSLNSYNPEKELAGPVDNKPGKKKKKDAHKSCSEQQQTKPSCCSSKTQCTKPAK